MANETILRKGFISNAASSVGGTLTVDNLTAASLIYPAADGTANQAILTNGSGTLSFASVTLAGANISTLTNDSNFISDITAESIGDLSDVTLTSLATNDILQYNGSAWVPVDIDTIMGAQNLADLGDVTITAAADGDFLRYNGSAWVDSTIQNGDIAEAAVTQHEAALTITESQISDLGTYQATSEKGQANGYASLDGSGLVPSAQLPSYVDDVEEYANEASFPGTGETGKLYVDLSDNSVHRWTGSAYVNITDYSTPGHTHVVSDITDFATGVTTELGNNQLEDLGDVTITSIATGNVIYWNGSAWVNAAPSTFTGALNDVSDVTITSVANDEILQYTGAGWENQTLAEAGIAATGHTHVAADVTDFSTAADARIAAAVIGDLSNVDTTGLATGDSLVYNGTNFVPVSAAGQNTTVVASDASTTVSTVTGGSTGSAEIRYFISDGTNMRTGMLLVVADGSSTEITDISTNMLGAEASEPEFAAAIDGSDLDINVTDGNGYTVKTITTDLNF